MANAPAVAAALFSGAVLRLVSPPIGLHWLHWVSFVPLFVAVAAPARVENTPGHGWVRRVLLGRNFRLGYLTGFSGVFLLFFWLAQTIDTFSNIPLPVAALIVGLFAAVFGLPYGFLAAAVAPLRERLGAGWVFAFPTLWVTAEFVQPSLFPYYQGVGQYRNPYTWQLASVFGAYGLSWLIIATNATIAEVVVARRARRNTPVVPMLITSGLLAGTLTFGAWRFAWVEAELQRAPVAKIALLQQGVSMVQHISERGQTVLDGWVTLTARVVADRPDLVIWPEGSIYNTPTERRVRSGLAEMSRAGGFAFFLGGGTREADPDDPTRRAMWNSAYLFGKDGEVKGRYDKMVPMPFGEYLPWPASYLKPYIQGVGSFRAGDEATVFHTEKFSFTSPICYEAILESQMRALSAADVFINITNDGWFGDTAAPHQHAMLAAAYATELGRPMVRVAYTGISMVVEPHGVIRYETEPYKEVAKVVDLRLTTFETPYRTWGRYFPHACAMLVALVAAAETVRVVTRRTPSA
ncbi:MAG: apolipoprotein N-acyltransferase [Myxococcales bacterium]|nr:apolipoprotein N-acyltransferase [Myxococcales bacterium]